MTVKLCLDPHCGRTRQGNHVWCRACLERVKNARWAGIEVRTTRHPYVDVVATMAQRAGHVVFWNPVKKRAGFSAGPDPASQQQQDQ